MTPQSLPEWAIVGFGLAGQGLFGARMVVQWWASERARASVVPVMYWYLSLAGGAVLFAYAAYRRDPVFMLGQVLGVGIYLRNLWLMRSPVGAPGRSNSGDDACAAALAPADERA